MQRGSLVSSRPGNDHEHQLGPVFVAVDDRWRIFNLSGNERDAGWHLVVTAINHYRDVLADLELADHRFGHEKSDLDILGREHLDNRPSCRHPLAFAVAEAHARGLQLHAWINPFRAGNTADTATLARSHVYYARRDLVRVYGSNLWMDPGDPETHERSIRAIRDIVARYDIDGIHADDYFYPYQINDSVSKRVVPFPDDSTYARYGRGVDHHEIVILERRARQARIVQRPVVTLQPRHIRALVAASHRHEQEGVAGHIRSMTTPRGGVVK